MDFGFQAFFEYVERHLGKFATKTLIWLVWVTVVIWCINIIVTVVLLPVINFDNYSMNLATRSALDFVLNTAMVLVVWIVFKMNKRMRQIESVAGAFHEEVHHLLVLLETLEKEALPNAVKIATENAGRDLALRCAEELLASRRIDQERFDLISSQLVVDEKVPQ